jgi:hypothetical protein
MSYEANGALAAGGIPRLLENLNFRYREHKSPQLYFTLDETESSKHSKTIFL